MALRISRGLFRLRFVLSAFWVAAVAAHTWEAIPTTIEAASSSVANTDPGGPTKGAKLPNHSASRRDDDWSDVSRLLLSDADVGISAARPTASLRDTMLDASQIAFVPPLLVLTIGSALGWGASNSTTPRVADVAQLMTIRQQPI
jgi:hypothetical protein